MNPRRTLLILGLLLAAVTIGAFWPILRADFINYDDPDYVTANEAVQRGLNWSSVVWAFTTGHAGNWHPVTWLSHMLDVTLYGTKATGHHATSLILHVTNAVLLLLLLRAMTGSMWRSAIAAAFFAWHPLRVESVAWVSERKDLLSAFFGLLTLLAYCCYVREFEPQNPKSGTKRRRAVWTYGLGLTCFALGLMSKPMLVTWPFVMLLLDYWPLGRWQKAEGGTPTSTHKWRGWQWLVVEKVPFFTLAAASSIITLLVQQRGGAMEANYPLGVRLANAPIAGVRYLLKTVYPTELAVFYPFPSEWPFEQVAAAGVVLGGISVAAFWLRRSRPFGLVGWLWFIGMLVPTIGMVQVGGASMADRYTYLPSMGLFLGAVWMVAALADRSRGIQRAMVAVGSVALAALVTATFKQAGVWQNSRLLWQHTLAVTTQNEVAHNNLGTILQQEEDWEGARQQYEAALAIKSTYYADAHFNLGNVLRRLERFDEGRQHLLKAIAIKPTFVQAHLSLASLEFQAGHWPAAEQAAREALRIKPGWSEAHKLLGNVFAGRRQYTNAVEEFEAALNGNDADVDTRFNLGSALRELGRSAEAMTQYLLVIRAKPSDLDARRLLAAEQARVGDVSGALTNLVEALRLCPDATSELQLAQMLMGAGRSTEAIAHYRTTVKLKPEWAIPCNNLAWLLATSADPAIRNGLEAVGLAEQACTQTGYKEPLLLGTLAAAYAEAGRFSEAIGTAEKAIALAQAAKSPAIVERNRQLLELYRAGKAFHEEPPQP